MINATQETPVFSKSPIESNRSGALPSEEITVKYDGDTIPLLVLPNGFIEISALTILAKQSSIGARGTHASMLRARMNSSYFANSIFTGSRATMANEFLEEFPLLSSDVGRMFGQNKDKSEFMSREQDKVCMHPVAAICYATYLHPDVGVLLLESIMDGYGFSHEEAEKYSPPLARFYYKFLGTLPIHANTPRLGDVKDAFPEYDVDMNIFHFLHMVKVEEKGRVKIKEYTLRTTPHAISEEADKLKETAKTDVAHEPAYSIPATSEDIRETYQGLDTKLAVFDMFQERLKESGDKVSQYLSSELNADRALEAVVAYIRFIDPSIESESKSFGLVTRLRTHVDNFFSKLLDN